MKIENPATGNVLREVQVDTPKAIHDKVVAAKKAQAAWAKLPYSTRAACIEKFVALVAIKKDELARILSEETGKPIKQAHNELGALAGRIGFFLANTEKTLESKVVSSDGGMTETIKWEPLGVVANISAWNYPYFVGSNVYVPALLTGNAVIYKPSEFALGTGQATAELLWEAGVPKDVFQIVVGGGDAGTALVAEDVDGIFFTGSNRTGRKIAEDAAGRMIRLQLELGGKDPTYVCEDADPKVAAESLSDGAMYNAGQSCCSVERIYVNEKNAPAFVEAFVESVKGFVVGEPSDEQTYIGPLARAAQIKVLEEQVADAVAKGAKILVGGKKIARPGNYFEPTVLVNVNHSMRVMKEESFGPIIGIQVVKSDDEAIAAMNDTEYGLTAGIYTKDQSRAERVLAEVDAGSTYWNCCDRVSPRLPWTGRRGSGMGSTLSTIGIQAFVQPKAWHMKQAT
ncbi:MAG: aldehyde dehydrogenase family protein [Polyangiaceae bacterium]|nr:aldehyde dehydrogenase family protein [Polyangiaceae bacterium]